MYVFMAITLTTSLLNKMELVWSSVQVGLTMSLGGWRLYSIRVDDVYSRLVNGVFKNNRIARVGIGFYNVNILGGLSGLLVFVSLVNVFRSKFRYSSAVTSMFGIYLLLNSGTRSSMLALSCNIIGLYCGLLQVGEIVLRRFYFSCYPAFFVTGRICVWPIYGKFR